MDKPKKMPIIVSACLAGEFCRYDCKAKPNLKIIEMVKNAEAIPVCPEQLGGLSTPRDPAEIKNEKVISNKGKDVTENYSQGAQEALIIALESQANEAILKSRSPMCGTGKVYDGTFTGNLKNGDGVFTQLLKKNGFKVTSEE